MSHSAPVAKHACQSWKQCKIQVLSRQACLLLFTLFLADPCIYPVFFVSRLTSRTPLMYSVLRHPYSRSSRARLMTTVCPRRRFCFLYFPSAFAPSLLDLMLLPISPLAHWHLLRGTVRSLDSGYFLRLGFCFPPLRSRSKFLLSPSASTSSSLPPAVVFLSFSIFSLIFSCMLPRHHARRRDVGGSYTSTEYTEQYAFYGEKLILARCRRH